MRLIIAMIAGRIAGRLSRLFGRGGSALPGLVAEWIAPNLVERLAGSVAGGVVVVTGTNGKTTTTKMLVRALEASGATVLTNPTGSNLSRGIATRLISVADLRGRIGADLAVFEVDEAALRTLSPVLAPKLVVVTNLARDQLDRYGELATTAGHIAEALDHAGSAVLNGDDPMVAALGEGRSAWYVGAVEDIRGRLPHDRQLHGDTGPGDPTVSPDAVVRTASGDAVGVEVEILLDGDFHRIELPMPGIYNAYNAAAALLASHRLGVSGDVAAGAISTMTPAFGRGQVIEYRGREVLVVLVKNPAGFNQAISLLAEASEPTSVLVAINDNHADGRDVSWLWDASVEDLASTAHRFGAGGIRAADMVLRFKYAGVDAWSDDDLATALDRVVDDAPEGAMVYVVPTYTAMLDLLDLLRPGVSRAEAWL